MTNLNQKQRSKNHWCFLSIEKRKLLKKLLRISLPNFFYFFLLIFLKKVLLEIVVHT